jgi:hypothetical protein
MPATCTFHPLAGIDPPLIVVDDMSWSFLIVPVAACALLLGLLAYARHLAVRRFNWPVSW